MKYRRFRGQSIGIGLAAIALLSSCSQDAAEEQFTPTPVIFTASGLQASVATRATVDGTWSLGDEVAVQIEDVIKKYSVSSLSDDMKTATLTSSDPFYWQNAQEVKTVSAWYPYSEINPIFTEVKNNQNDKDEYYASDLMRANDTRMRFAEAKRLTFSHCTAKVVVNLIAGDGVSSVDDLDVVLCDVKISSSGFSPVGDVYTYNNYTALLPPQTIVAGTKFICVEPPGNDIFKIRYYYTPTEAIALKAGTQYTYNITVNKTGLTVSAVSSSMSWENGGTGSGNAAIQ